jgi:hypothetical protein
MIGASHSVPLAITYGRRGTLCIACDTEGPPLKTTYDKPINQSDIGLAWLSVFPHIMKKQ